MRLACAHAQQTACGLTDPARPRLQGKAPPARKPCDPGHEEPGHLGFQPRLGRFACSSLMVPDVPYAASSAALQPSDL